MILNQTNCSSYIRKGFEKDSTRTLDACGKHSLKKSFLFFRAIMKPNKQLYSRNIRKLMLFSLTGL